MITNRPHNKTTTLIADILELEGLAVAPVRAINSCVNQAFINTFSAASYYHDYIQVSNYNIYPL